MKRSLLSAAVACAFVASASVAEAQNMSPVKFGLSAGASIPTGNIGQIDGQDVSFSDVVSTGYHVTGHLGFMAPMVPVGLRADVSWNKFGGKDFSGVSAPDLSILSGTLNGIFNLSAGMPASPYILAGVGAYRSKPDCSGVDCDANTDFGLNGGLGMKFNLSGFSTFAEARYHFVMSEDKDTGAENIKFIPISFGIMF